MVYNGHKRKHKLKYQAVQACDGLILQAAGPIDGHRHDWTLYVRSGLEQNYQRCWKLVVPCTEYMQIPAIAEGVS